MHQRSIIEKKKGAKKKFTTLTNLSLLKDSIQTCKQKEVIISEG